MTHLLALCVPVTPGNLWKDVERRLLVLVLRQHRGNKTAAALDLGISIRTVRNKIMEYEIDEFRKAVPKQFRRAP